MPQLPDITISLPATQALYFAAVFKAMEETIQHPYVQGVAMTLHDKIKYAIVAQLNQEQIDELTK